MKPRRSSSRLEYGDGKADGKKSLGGSGHLIRFEAPEQASPEEGVRIKSIRIHGSRYGTKQAPREDFEISFLSDDMSEVLAVERAAYGLFRRGEEKWVTVRFKESVELPETKAFWIGLDFAPGRTKGVYVSYDTETEGEHSRVGLAADPEEVKEVDFKGDWMVQVILERADNRRAASPAPPAIASRPVPVVGLSTHLPPGGKIAEGFGFAQSPSREARPQPRQETRQDPPRGGDQPRETVARISILGSLTRGGPPRALAPPSEQDVIEALAADSARASAGLDEQVDFRRVRIKLQKVAEYLDPPQVYPLVGYAQMHHAHYKVQVHAPGQNSPRVVWLDHRHLHVSEPQTVQAVPGLDNEPGIAAGRRSADELRALVQVRQSLKSQLQSQLEQLRSTHGASHPQVRQIQQQLASLGDQLALAERGYANQNPTTELATPIEQKRLESTVQGLQRKLEQARAEAQQQQRQAEQLRLEAERAVAELEDRFLGSKHELHKLLAERQELALQLRKAQQALRQQAVETEHAKRAAEAERRRAADGAEAEDAEVDEPAEEEAERAGAFENPIRS